MIKDIIQTFLPWIIYLLISGHSSTQMKIAISVAAIVSIFSERKGIKKKFILSWVTLIFFIFMFFSVALLDNQWILKHAWVLSNTSLAFVAWFSILIKRPFTLQYAKERTSSDKWNHPLFWRINYILTAVWGSIFLLSAGINILRIYSPYFNIWLYELFTDGAVIFGIWFSAWFPSWYAGKRT